MVSAMQLQQSYAFSEGHWHYLANVKASDKMGDRNLHEFSALKSSVLSAANPCEP